MFEGYTEKARRVLFFARYEASKFGASAIEEEHILLGLIREDLKLGKYLSEKSSSSLQVLLDKVREKITTQTTVGEQIPTSVDIPLSQTAKDVLIAATEESKQLNHQTISTEHLLLSLLKKPNTLSSAILAEYGLTYNLVCSEWLHITPQETPMENTKKPSQLTEVEKNEKVAALIDELANMRALASTLLSKCDQIEKELKDILTPSTENSVDNSLNKDDEIDKNNSQE